MKTIKLLAVLFIATLSFTSCSDDDDTPDEVIEEEVITTMNVTLTSEDGDIVTLSSVDLDGDAGSDAPVITGGTLLAGTTYTGSIELLNETESPAEDITEEIEELAEEHQFFFASNDGSISFSYDDEDANGDPIGLAFSLVTGEEGTSTITITLRHEPTKPNDGLADAGGSTDIEVSFPIVVE